ncbi:hypothetical protein [Fictibacillus phosphorivorans]|uniref:hypothetical protein n=1 Tax=Fictibacillus phosphorivorans TaxID=1221500 RepID=UPI00203E64BB|nr:hypothetical protein [Fictibacillus phosphorivorans]MCM3719621.1 hypothetical protein [Fictibacillus phosphorivorans]MCM3777305.1 hypothetical protein [Fictibacillus phosphorivorans]
MKHDDLKFATRFNMLKDSNKSILLPNENRTLRIEKTWNNGYQFYVLYSVDLLERDKNEAEIPKLRVDKIIMTTNKGEGFETEAQLFKGNTDLEGYVYKHRFYRSFMVYPNFEDVQEKDWEKFSNSERLELTSLSINSSKGETAVDSLAFKINPNGDTIASSKVEKTLKLYDSTEIKLNKLEFYQMGTRLTTDKHKNDHLIGFSGWNKDSGFPIEYGIHKGPNGKTYIESFSIMNLLLMMDRTDQSEFTVSQSLHVTDGSYSFIVPKKEMAKAVNNPDVQIQMNQSIVVKEGIKAFYKGLIFDQTNNQFGIKFTLETNAEPIDNYMFYPKPQYHYQNIDEMEQDKRYLANLVSIKDSKGKELEDYGVESIITDRNSEFMISFYDDIPKDDLTITLSNLTRIEPLKKEIKIPVKFPALSK